MGKRDYILTIKCTEPNCTECVHYNYPNKKEYSEDYIRHKNYKCLRHSNDKEVLSLKNTLVSTELISTKSETNNNLFWANEGKLGSGFTHGTGFRCWAEDFPEGTILKITAEIILKN